MDTDDFFDRFTWGGLAFAFLALLVVALVALYVGIARLVYMYRRRRRNGGKAPVPALSIEQLLKSIPDVPYQELPAAAGAGSGGGGASAADDRDSCVICVTPYEAGERCSVLPGCSHVFHKACIAPWLRNHTRRTCPLCRAPVVAKQGNAAENMV